VYRYIKIMLKLLQYKTVTKIRYLQTPLGSEITSSLIKW